MAQVNLFVGGCSFSSPFNLDPSQSWPALVANETGYNLIDESSIAGSNYRIWRKTVTAIENRTISPNDIVIIQYTEPHRSEFYSPLSRNIEFKDRHAAAEEYHNGYIVKNKWGLEITGVGKEKKYGYLSRFFSCDEFDMERFEIEHAMFQGYLQNLGFKRVAFIVSNYFPALEKTLYPVIDCNDVLKHHQPNDTYHLNELGHTMVAQRVLNLIKP